MRRLTAAASGFSLAAMLLSVTVSAAAAQNSAQITGPDIPVVPDLVTVVPFQRKENETDLEKTKVLIVTEVDGVHGNFILDTGDYDVDLNRTFLQPNPKGGVDSITDANRIPEQGWDTVRVKLRIGTLLVDLTGPEFGPEDPRPGKAVLDHAFGDFSWVYAPRLGNIGVPALESFETIIDYTHQRVIFIRLDKTGHRLAEVPSYTSAVTIPLVPTQDRLYWGIAVSRGATIDTLLLDTGNPGDDADERAADQLKQAIAAGKDVSKTPFAVDEEHPSGLGFLFLHKFGVVGFNFRANQFVLYR